MLDFLLITARNHWYTDRPTLSNGAVTLASYVADKGHAIRVIDDNGLYRRYDDRDFIDIIRTHRPKAVGLSVHTLNAYESYRLCEVLKREFPELIVVGGGLHSYDSPFEMVDQPFDFVFSGEAELSLTAFLDLLKSADTETTASVCKAPQFVSTLKGIPGLLFKADGQTVSTGPATLLDDLDEIPMLDFGLANLEDFVRSEHDHHSITNTFVFQRGCPFRCNYCKSAILPSKIRSNSAARMVGEIRRRHEQYGINNFTIADNNFTINKGRLNEFCDLMISTGLSQKISLFIQSSVTIPISDEQMERMKEAGTTFFSLGVERFDDEVRRKLDKAGTCDVVRDLIMKINRHGMKVNINLLLNTPYDTAENLEAESKILDEMMPYLSFCHINYMIPMPGTVAHNYCQDDEKRSWYLDPNIRAYVKSYYEDAFLVANPALELNPFGLPDDTLKAIRSFKHACHRQASVRMNRSLLFRVACQLDFLLAAMSYALHDHSPKLERQVFRPFRHLRAKGFKVFFNRYVFSHSTE